MAPDTDDRRPCHRVRCTARTGAPQDSWAIDHRAQLNARDAAKQAGVTQVVLLSAICVQQPLLAIRQAKLAFEKELIASGRTGSVVRPTALFKSLSGQVARVQRGKPFLVFGDGTLTACKPISDADLADHLASCLDDPARQNRVLPALVAKAERARIGRYDAATTPSTGTETLADHHRALISEAAQGERVDHAVF